MILLRVQEMTINRKSQLNRSHVVDARAFNTCSYFAAAKMHLFLTPFLILMLGLLSLVDRGGMQQLAPVCRLHFEADLRDGRESGLLHIVFTLEEEDICQNTYMVCQMQSFVNTKYLLLCVLHSWISDWISHALVFVQPSRFPPAPPKV